MTSRARFNPRRLTAVFGAVAAVALAAPAASAASAVAGISDVTKGPFHTFAAGIGQGLDVGGAAIMVRTPANRTIVVVFASGLAPNTTYGAHVHKQACANGDAGMHFKFDPDGPADSINEIWPGFTTDRDGRAISFAQNVGIPGPTAVSVVIHAPGGAKIACADLA